METKLFLNKVVLITGGTGSFGQKCIGMLLKKNEVKKIIILSRDELKQSQMQQNISDPENKLRFFIGDVRDLDRLQMAFKGVDYVIHASALKQVPALEYNPFEAVQTNIIGTKNVITAALDQKVKKVVLVSTDKAANPATLYGATKLCAERLIISANAYSGLGQTRLSAVRYGNVLGSRGSIMKVIENQRNSGEVTLTHEEMTRFWITLEQGVNLVFMALEKMQGGEIFVPKIPSMKVKDFILNLAPECKLKVVGIRPGEKIHEILVTTEEARHTREFDNHYVIFPEHDWWNEIDEYKDAKKMTEGAYYSSDNNTQWLADDEFSNLMSLV